MQAPITATLHHAPAFMKTVAASVIVAFLGLTLQPLAIAANAPPQAASAAKPLPVVAPPSNEERLGRTIDTLEDRLDKLETKLTKKERTEQEQNELKVLRQTLETQDTQALEDFRKIEKHLKDKNLPKVILDRQFAMVKTYKADMATLKTNLDEIDKAKDDTERKVKAKQTREYLKAKQAKRAHVPLDPKNLPTRVLKPNKANQPKVRKQEFVAAGLYDNPTVKLAALGDFKFDKLAGASDPAYLAPTPEVVLSDAIKAKALELNHDPVKIFNWVRANTEWIPTWGAIQNADEVLGGQKANAVDIASLLIALLRASGIPARYVHGTVDIPADKFMNWAGNFTDSNGAWDFASAAGLPMTGLTSGGKVVAFRMEHVWVEAAIDFYPSRGAVNKSADTWVTLDASFKQYTAERGYDMYTRLGFNGEQFMTDYFANGGDKTPYQFYSKKVTDDLDVNIPDWTLLDLYGHERVDPLREVVGADLRMFAASLPYKVVTKGYNAATIPDPLRAKITIDIANNPTYGSDATYTVALSELGRERLTLSYIPDTAADTAVVDDYGSLFASPAYLVHVKPVLRKAGVTVAVGFGVTLGEKQFITLNLQSPSITEAPVTKKITAGSYNAIVIQGQKSTIDRPSINMQLLMHNAELNEQGSAQFDDLMGQLLHNIGVLWFFNLVYERDFYATTLQVAYTSAPSSAFISADLDVFYFLGIPRSVKEGFLTVDARQDVMVMSALNGENARKKDFMILSGMIGSAWEHLIFESLFNVPGASAVKLLQLATAQGIPVYKIDKSNISQILPLLSIPGDDLTDIVNAVNAGLEVTVSQKGVQLGTYNGVGYIVLDPITGAGPYYLSGGVGGWGCSDTRSMEKERL